MHFFGVRVGLFWLKLQGADPNNYYCNLTATRKDSVEIMDTKHKVPPTYGAMWTKKPLYMEFTFLRVTVDQVVVGSTPIRHP
jgi:hypothetical protein